MRVLVTRPQPQAGQWQRALTQAGFEAGALPLLQLGPLPDPGPLREVCRHVDRYHAVMFVSAAAVHHFFQAFAAAGHAAQAWTAIKTRAWGTGPGTRRALHECAVGDDRIDTPAATDARFDSETLWRRVQPQAQAGRAVLIVRGAQEGDDREGSGRDWFAQQLRAAGVLVDLCAAYQRGPAPPVESDVRRARQAASDGSVWIFSASEAVATLGLWCPDQDWSAARAVATHSRIAQRVIQQGFGLVRESPPTLEAVAQTLRTLG